MSTGFAWLLNFIGCGLVKGISLLFQAPTEKPDLKKKLKKIPKTLFGIH